jgi:radical SAM protein with 4Fe4S-binding SPASM domain
MGGAEAGAALEKLAEAGTLFLTLTGGEPLVREDFFDVAERARRLNFSVRIFTNGTLVDERAADRIAGLAPFEVGVSVYGVRRETHEEITGAPGSFDATMRCLRLLAERGVRLTVKSVIMKPNFGEYGELIEFARGIGARHVFDATVFPRDDGGRGPLELRLDERQLETVLRDPRFYPRDGNPLSDPNPPSPNPEPRTPEPGLLRSSDSGFRASKRFLPSPNPEPFLKPCRGPVCDLNFVSIGISPEGEVFPCLQLRRPCGNVLEDEIGAIREKLAEIVDKYTINNLKDCYNCIHWGDCARCPGLAMLEDGDELGKSGWACKTARIRERMRKR